MTTLNLNQFKQVPIKGQRDLQLEQSGILSGVISDSQGSALAPGAAVKLDTAIGTIIYDVKSSQLSAGDPVQVALDYKSIVMWMTCGGTIAAGAFVEDKGDGTIQTITNHAMRGQALDPGVATDLIRVLLRNATAV